MAIDIVSRLSLHLANHQRSKLFDILVQSTLRFVALSAATLPKFDKTFDSSIIRQLQGAHLVPDRVARLFITSRGNTLRLR